MTQVFCFVLESNWLFIVSFAHLLMLILFSVRISSSELLVFDE
jgi:hypothetical protein